MTTKLHIPKQYPCMKHIDAGIVAEELIKVFSLVGVPSRVRVPQEILTDQGTNFTSQLLIELYRMLHNQPIRTTSYHLQTDGLVEQTLKLMLRKTAGQDVTICSLRLQGSTANFHGLRFSPFELLYGHQVHGS